MTSDKPDIDGLLAAARGRAAEPSADLLARVLADAYALQPAAPMAPVTARPAPRPRWAGLLALFGGGAGLAGLVTAGVAGLMIGLLQPAPVSAFTGAMTGVLGGAAAPLETVELIPSFDGWQGEDSDG